MLFPSIHFLIFLPVVWTLYHFAGKYRNALLLVASLYFYAAWNFAFLGLLFFSIVVDYVAGLSIEKLPTNDPKRKLYLFLSLAVNLGFLGYFKYTNFLLGIWNDFSPTSFKFSVYDILLPVGISFYTFQSMSYTIDVYNSKIPARKSFLEFALYVSFFPQLVAGPIVRAQTFFRDLEVRLHVDSDVFKDCVAQIVLGFTKKIVFADNLALCVDQAFSSPASLGSIDTWIAVFAFMWQIYFDFSGYTDIAIGVARLFGFQFDRNFYFPFHVTSISEHWSRWHISFTSWIRDYIFIPLGGSRGSELFICRNIAITFLFGGIWHGAAYHFLGWGVWHSIMIITERQYAKTALRNFLNEKGGWFYLLLCWIFTMVCLAMGLPLFRANSLPEAFGMIHKMLLWTKIGTEPILYLQFGKLIFLLFVCGALFQKYQRKRLLENSFAYGTFLFANFFLMLCFSVSEAKNFIYFAF